MKIDRKKVNMRILIRVISVVGVIGVCVRVLFWIGIIIYSSRFAGVGIIGGADGSTVAFMASSNTDVIDVIVLVGIFVLSVFGLYVTRKKV
jgi:Na+-transporting methylmalonyl-CoA/oxaloacetate decarboxylase beta subunit